MNHFRDIPPDNASRRAFLRRGAALSFAAGATPWALSLAAMGEAAAATATDYKALVCVFLYGGNDYANTLVAYDQASWDTYNSYRSNIALPRSALAATVLNPAVPPAGGKQYALAPGLAPLLPIFGAGKMSVVLNVGTLVQPTSKTQYTNKSVLLPPKLFSHNDQQSYWQAASPEGAASGWGGRIGDLFASGNGNATFSCVSVAGNAVFLSGKSAVQYQVTTTGSVPVAGIKSPLFGSSACSTALQNLMVAPHAHLFESEYARVSQRSIDANDQLTAALSGVSVNTVFPAGNSLGDQLKMVASMIAARNALGAKRQVFFVSLGGFDTHDSLASAHPALMATVGDALAAFYQSTVDLGVANQVTTFTASDFGRTLLSNTSGSDHGWGSMHFVLGGSVLGGSYVGTPPVLGNGGVDDVGQGRLLPALSVDQFGATLGSWFGVSASDQASVMPNLANFGTANLGFMAAG
ncbi:MAG: Tat pathway signal protein [Ramlibacter sp.]|nr:Tat pathway signal protein [Ramlibacter sp.]